MKFAESCLSWSDKKRSPSIVKLLRLRTSISNIIVQVPLIVTLSPAAGSFPPGQFNGLLQTLRKFSFVNPPPPYLGHKYRHGIPFKFNKSKVVLTFPLTQTNKNWF